jgi:pyruvate dehydrogenase E2 component (dihydrolipoamide acetyltransferase)
MTEFLMPKLGADMTAGRLVAWYKQPGDQVKRGDIVAEVETEKGNIDVEIFSDGVIEKLLVQPGQSVPVGAPLALVRSTEADAASQITVVDPSSARPAPASPSQPIEQSQPPSDGRTRRLQLTPAARRRARELGIDSAAIIAAGRMGVVTLDDIEAIARDKSEARPEIQEANRKVEPALGMNRSARLRQTIAAAMTHSKREIPHYYLSTTIDMDATLRWLTRQNAGRQVVDRLLPGVIVLKAVAMALKQFPELNAVWENDRVVTKPDIHVGVAISLREGGLVAPALHHADRLNLDELMAKLRDLVNRTRAGSLRSSELADPTITVTNLGDQGVESVFGIIYPPQVALVGIGKLSERPWIVNGNVVARPLLTATLSADHRVTDGHRGGLFLAKLNQLLQQPSQL